jgi:translocation and assembly module TamA
MRLVLALAVWALALATQAQTPAMPPESPAPAAASAASAASAPLAASAAAPSSRRPAPPIWKLVIHAPAPLDDLLRSYLDLARDEAATRSELRRLVAAAPAQARSLLEAEGYFAADIRMKMGEDQPGVPTPVHMEVEPGPKTHITQVQLVFEGELDNRLSKDDPATQALVEQLNQRWALPKGQVFTQSQWSSAKSATLAILRAQGYPTATWSGTAATVDAQQHTAKLFVVADSGPAYAYGELLVRGLKHQPASAVRNLMSFKIGDPYREKQLLDFQERVQKLNLFESVFVNVNEDPEQAAAAAVTVDVRELPLQQATVGVGVSSDTGPRVSLEHLHRLPWGLAWQAKSKIQIGRDESIVQTDLTSHPRPGGKRWLASFQWSRLLDTDHTETRSGRVRLGQTDEGERLERTSYVEYQRADVLSADGDRLSEASALMLMQQWIWRDTDSVVLPTQGFTANAYLGVGRSFSTLDDSGWFGRAYARMTWYRPLAHDWYASVRGEFAQVLVSDQVSVPDTLLYRAGGDESVRGYGYRTLGVEKDGVTLGGRSMMTGSVELAHPLMTRFPTLWGALFADVGDAALTLSELRPQWGYGAGLRWRSPVGPLRLDAAYGQSVKAVRLHFSVGITL